MDYFLMLVLNILFVGSLWHLDINHNLDKHKVEKTSGFLKIKPEQGYRLSQYVLILSLILIDLLFVLK